jgi:hypothetical protein
MMIYDHLHDCDKKTTRIGLLAIAFVILLLLAAIALAAGVDPKLAFSPPRQGTLEEELYKNEQACAKEKRPGFASYVVSRNGLLRGCLLVKENADPIMRTGTIFIWKRPPL